MASGIDPTSGQTGEQAPVRGRNLNKERKDVTGFVKDLVNHNNVFYDPNGVLQINGGRLTKLREDYKNLPPTTPTGESLEDSFNRIIQPERFKNLGINTTGKTPVDITEAVANKRLGVSNAILGRVEGKRSVETPLPPPVGNPDDPKNSPLGSFENPIRVSLKDFKGGQTRDEKTDNLFKDDGILEANIDGGISDILAIPVGNVNEEAATEMIYYGNGMKPKEISPGHLSQYKYYVVDGDGEEKNEDPKKMLGTYFEIDEKAGVNKILITQSPGTEEPPHASLVGVDLFRNIPGVGRPLLNARIFRSSQEEAREQNESK